MLGLVIKRMWVQPGKAMSSFDHAGCFSRGKLIKCAAFEALDGPKKVMSTL